VQVLLVERSLGAARRSGRCHRDRLVCL